MATESYTLPNGVTVVTHTVYTDPEPQGALALAITAGISLCAVITMLIAIAVQGFKTRYQFIRSQVGAYFLSLVLSDLLQATGSVMNSRWVVIEGVRSGSFCTAQAGLKQTGNVGTAVWSLVIAAHTFCLLFLRLRVGDFISRLTLIGGWLFIAFIVMMGPVIIQSAENGPFWGVSGFWCWITSGYPVEQLTNEYMFMFITAGTSFILYALIFLRLRGNLQGSGWNLRLCRVSRPWIEEDDDSQISAAGKKMLWYPVAYTIIILPIAACRWSKIFGHEVPPLVTMVADSIFMLSGFVNFILYSTTRKIVSIRALLPFARLIRIGPTSSRTRTVRLQTAMTSKSTLEDMEFAIPPLDDDKRAPRDKEKGKGKKSPVTGSPVSPLPLWAPSPRGGVGRAEHLQPLGLFAMDSASETSAEGRMSEQHAAIRSLVAALNPLPPPPRARSTSDPSIYSCSSAVRPTPAPTLAPATQKRPHIQSIPSQTSIPCTTGTTSTDGAPSVHRKRFSGWSFPSVDGGGGAGAGGGGGAASQGEEDGEDGYHTELEEMQFATPPSPQLQLRMTTAALPPPPHPHPHSPPPPPADVPTPMPKWPPRAISLD